MKYKYYIYIPRLRRLINVITVYKHLNHYFIGFLKPIYLGEVMLSRCGLA